MILVKLVYVAAIASIAKAMLIKEANAAPPEGRCSTRYHSHKRTLVVSSVYQNQKTTLGRLDFQGESRDIRLSVENAGEKLCVRIPCSSLIAIDQKSQELSLVNLNSIGISIKDLFKLRSFTFAIVCQSMVASSCRRILFSIIFEQFGSSFNNYLQRNDDIFTSQFDFGESSNKIKQKILVVPNEFWPKGSEKQSRFILQKDKLAKHSSILNRAKRRTIRAQNDTDLATQGTNALSSEITSQFEMPLNSRESSDNLVSTTPGSSSSPNFLPAFVVFLVLFLISLLVIGYLVYRLRKIKKQSKRTQLSRPYWQSFPSTKTLDFTKARPTIKDDAASIDSSFSSSPISNFQPTPRKPEIPQIIPLEPQALKRYEIPVHEELAEVIPYHSSSMIQQWSIDDVNILNLKQIRVENWLQETEEKKCGVGEVSLENPTPCFVKILKNNFEDKQLISDDLASMSQLLHYQSCDHPNLVKFYGSCMSKDNSLYMVSEFISSRSLVSVLVSSRTIEHSAVISTMSGTQLMNFAIGISEALFYLHGNQVVHGALNASHVILNDRSIPKLYDCCGENSKRLKLKTCRWSSPEVSITQQYTEKADVWAFGVLMWEILSLGGLPFFNQSENKVEIYIRKQLQSGGSILPVTRNSTKRLWLLLQSCWSQDPSDRPDISEVKSKLKRMKDATVCS